jgi:RNA polymerase sigma-54 factor
MAINARQTQQQRLIIAPNVTLALEVLRMPNMELQAFLRQQLEENPCLEAESDDGSTQSSDSPDTPESQAERTDQSAPEPGGDEDWTSHWRTATEREEGGDDDREDGWRDSQLVLPQSLHESLRMQVGCLALPERDRQHAELLIERLDQYGYLDDSLEALVGELKIPSPELERALSLVQSLDPPGVGARTLRECLMIQLKLLGQDASLAYTILRDHFDLFAEHRLAALAKASGTTTEQVAAAYQQLKGLNPKPGSAFAGDLPPSVIPDLIVHHREDHYDVELNDQQLPQVIVNRTYHRMLKNPATPSDVKEFLAQNVRKATWLVKAIEERSATLLAVARCLISLQREFLEQGAKSLKPLTQAQVAALVGRHASTVSRAIAGKTIDTPYGIFRLEQMFASGVRQPTDDASATTSVSDETIKSEIQRLVAEEDPRKCFSDAALVRRLAERNIVVARRTIAKYRTALKILPAHLRKHRPA